MWPFKKESAAEEEAPEFCRFLDEDAERLRDALRKRDWETARGILGATDPETRSYYFSVAASTYGIERWITGAEPGAALPLLIRGAALLTSAWELRPDGWTGRISDAAAELWTRWVSQAAACIDEVTTREPGWADAWTWSIALSRSLGLPLDERWRRFHRLIEIEPDHWYGHEQMLLALTPKWGGSSEAVFDFARTRAAACPGTHIPALVALAHREHNAHLSAVREPDNPDRSLELTYYEPTEITDDLWEAAQLSFWHDDYETTVLTPIVWNNFAYAFAWGDFHKPAWALFDSIGEDWITRSPWGDVEFFLRSRDYTRDNLE
ncbi:hypothetical protein FHR83_009027 [Actinoplanes campanulatus]|uniref:DUF4034 domain-containing protein n=1 Tax=Actinoplanes campanulatus TaxID=113559 RepID=A0A7W5AT12_9ACTN|nr:hypothetical protein [Actinoplanes campanulatus]MBB3101299.1 hypothetical protein [Actinoplanes campanulatus]GGN48645.1 hypothetical protein GCM10010109_85970 [Actinoplanes campanulatus]GID41687.1 hypothetical protein Aca09nite_81930 [Actinoplanes campanulatus]